ARAAKSLEKPQALPIEDAVAAFQQSARRRLLLDYDGTLVPYVNRPQDAVPPAALVELLGQLAADPTTAIAVISGRSRHDLENWFGQVRGLWLAAEHGAIMRSPETMRWELYHPTYTSEWKEHVFPVLEHFMDRTPGSLVEEKEFSLVWHYRMADPEFGEWLANELVSNLEQMLADTELRAFRGNKIVEVKPGWANKGEVLARLTEAAPHAEFCFAAGDDRTDEDLFARLSADAWTVHIGDQRTRAKYCLSNSGDLRRLLARFAAEPLSESRAAG
ncbi:MAG TPA: trehalose-phosphatase, partial [Pyrinomonadaceae bacterium]|nr:trehalose-phosphatase [Pyrinomonadaceae bacterium]